MLEFKINPQTRAVLGPLASGGVRVFAVNIASAGLGFLVHVVLARSMGLGHYGAYSIALSWLAVLAMLAMLGFDAVTVRFVAAYRERKEWALLRGLVPFGTRLILGLAVLFAVLWAAGVALLPIDQDTRYTLFVACLVLPALALLQHQEAILLGLRRGALARGISMVSRPVGILFIIAVAGFPSLNGIWAMLINLGVTVAAVALGMAAVRRSLPAESRQAVPARDARNWLIVGLPLLLVGGLTSLNMVIDVLLIGAVAGSAAAGLYAPATKLVLVIAFPLVALRSITAPMIAAKFAAGDRDEMSRIAALGTMFSAATGVPIALALALFPDFALSIFGPAFEQAATALRILAIGQLINALTGPVDNLLVMAGRERMAAGIMAVSVALNAGGNILLVPAFGIEGAAIATAFSMLAYNVMMLGAVWRVHGISPQAIVWGAVRRNIVASKG